MSTSRGYSRPESRKLLVLLPLFLLSARPVQGQSDAEIVTADQRVREKVSVDRVVVNAHVIDNFGSPIRGLAAEDFRVRVDGRDVPLESAEWVSPAEGHSNEISREVEAGSSVPSGRRIVLLFQWEIASQKQEGFLRMQRQAVEFLDSLGLGDRIAVLSFGSRLRLKQDFTDDREKLKLAVRNVLGDGEVGSGNEEGGFSLAERLGEEESRRATSIEKALSALGRTLELLPGKKSVLFFGWGIGQRVNLFRSICLVAQSGPGFVKMSKDYEAARRALSDTDASVFSLDISDADFHPLEAGLQKVSFDTGGFYAKTHLFPELAMQKLERTLSGHYVLVFRKPEAPLGSHAVRIDLVGKPGTVLHRRSYEDADQL